MLGEGCQPPGADRGLLDYLLLETSGAADPRQIVAALEASFADSFGLHSSCLVLACWSLLEVRFGPLARARLDRVVTVVDVIWLQCQMFSGAAVPEFLSQCEHFAMHITSFVAKNDGGQHKISQHGGSPNVPSPLQSAHTGDTAASWKQQCNSVTWMDEIQHGTVLINLFLFQQC